VRRSKKKIEQATADDAQALSSAPQLAGARAGGAVNLGQLEGEAAIGGGLTTPPGQNARPGKAKDEKPEEPKEAPRKKAHRWI
jgi:hypothetical protein